MLFEWLKVRGVLASVGVVGGSLLRWDSVGSGPQVFLR